MSESGLAQKIISHPLVIPLYLPAILFSIAEGLLIPTLPLFATELGFSYGMIGLVLAGESLGMLMSDLPSGLLLRRLGEKNAMVVGLGLMTLSTLTLFWVRSVPMFLICRLLAGIGISLYNVSRLAYIADEVPIINRGRVNAAFGGFKRIGAFLGPLVSGAVATIYSLQASFLVFVGLGIGAIMVVVFFVAPSPRAETSDNAPIFSLANIITLVRTNIRILVTAGVGNFLMLMIRTAPTVIVPLYGANILGLDIKSIGFILGISAAVDMLLFYPAGYIMDHLGRKHAILSSVTVLAIGLAVIPLARDFWTLFFIEVLIGLGNGLGSGTMLTLGADFSSKEHRGEFLGLWMFIGNIGSATGPLIVGTVASLFVLESAAWVFSGSGVLAALVFAMLVPETLKKLPVKAQTND
ncbi:MAG: MFS transporter [Anaerolineales bacterium]|jgi:MFS family permease